MVVKGEASCHFVAQLGGEQRGETTWLGTAARGEGPREAHNPQEKGAKEAVCKVDPGKCAKAACVMGAGESIELPEARAAQCRRANYGDI